jgi:hypothetical protein
MSEPEPAETRQLNNDELGRLVGLTASGASYLRSAGRMPGPETQRHIVENLGADWDEMNAAMLAARAGDPDRWVIYMHRLTIVPEDWDDHPPVALDK